MDELKLNRDANCQETDPRDSRIFGIQINLTTLSFCGNELNRTAAVPTPWQRKPAS
jgi:hypothetical protein